MRLQDFFGIQLPVIQAPMAGSQGSALAIAVRNAGGLGSLPCALLTPDAMRTELQSIRAATDRPFNVNFFCHAAPAADAEREAAWRGLLAPYFNEYGIDPLKAIDGPARAPFSAAAADVIAESPMRRALPLQCRSVPREFSSAPRTCCARRPQPARCTARRSEARRPGTRR
jgi:nitronate monooxygenase